jgi:hypothetical protein
MRGKRKRSNPGTSYSGEGCYNGRDRVPTGAAFPLRAQAALSQQPPPENNVCGNCDRTLIKRWPTCMRPLLQPPSKPAGFCCRGLQSYERTSAAFRVFILHVCGSPSLPSAESRALAPASRHSLPGLFATRSVTNTVVINERSRTTFPRLSPRRETQVVFTVYPPQERARLPRCGYGLKGARADHHFPVRSFVRRPCLDSRCEVLPRCFCGGERNCSF